MSLTNYQKKNFRQHTHTTDQLIDPATGDVAEIGGGSVDGIEDVPGLQAALDAKQALDSDLTAIAALSTTSFGRSLLAAADAAAARMSVGGSLISPRQTVFNAITNSTMALGGSAPLQTSTMFIAISGIAATCISSVTQTNVTWTLLRRKANGASICVELWVGIPTGTPGTSVTCNFSASQTATGAFFEIPAEAGLAGTLDQAADATGTSVFAEAGFIKPTADNAWSFAVISTNNGSIKAQGITGGPYFYTGVFSHTAIGYCWTGKNGVNANVPVQTNAPWAAMVCSVI